MALRLTRSSHALTTLVHTDELSHSFDSPNSRRPLGHQENGIQIVVDCADSPRRTVVFPTTSPLHSVNPSLDPVNPNLLTVKTAPSALNQQQLAVSLPTSPSFTPPDSPRLSPTTSPSLFRRRLSWRIGGRTKSSPVSQRQHRVKHSQSFSELLSRHRKPSRFSLDACMMDPYRLYWVITSQTVIVVGTEFEVSCL